jgi:hypothetical protein
MVDALFLMQVGIQYIRELRCCGRRLFSWRRLAG